MSCIESKHWWYLSKAHFGEFLPQHLGTIQGFAVVQNWNTHHGSFNIGAGHHQNLPQSDTQKGSRI